MKDARENLEMRLNGNTCGDYVRVRVRHDIRKPLTKYVSIVRAKERQVYLVRYEKLARFCKFCGLIGHDHKECGLGIHDEKDLKFGDWIYADAPNKPRPEKRPTKATCYQFKQADERATGRSEPKHVPYDAEVTDTATSPVKKSGDKVDGAIIPKRRLNLEEVGTIPGDVPDAPKALLAITDGNDNDPVVDASPTGSSSSSRRLKVNKDSDNNEIS